MLAESDFELTHQNTPKNIFFDFHSKRENFVKKKSEVFPYQTSMKDITQNLSRLECLPLLQSIQLYVKKFPLTELQILGEYELWIICDFGLLTMFLLLLLSLTPNIQYLTSLQIQSWRPRIRLNRIVKKTRHSGRFHQ